jgi:hypothetical protein
MKYLRDKKNKFAPYEWEAIISAEGNFNRLLILLENEQFAEQKSLEIQHNRPVAAAPHDDLMTLEDFAKITLKSAKTIRNKKILGKPARKGGGRGIEAAWHYLEKVPALERWLGDKLPSLVDAKSIISKMEIVQLGQQAEKTIPKLAQK